MESMYPPLSLEEETLQAIMDHMHWPGRTSKKAWRRLDSILLNCIDPTGNVVKNVKQAKARYSWTDYGPSIEMQFRLNPFYHGKGRIISTRVLCTACVLTNPDGEFTTSNFALRSCPNIMCKVKKGDITIKSSCVDTCQYCLYRMDNV
jgi:hypothetical protein